MTEIHLKHQGEDLVPSPKDDSPFLWPSSQISSAHFFVLKSASLQLRGPAHSIQDELFQVLHKHDKTLLWFWNPG